MILWRNSRLLLLLPNKLTLPGTKIELPNGVLLWLKYQPKVLDDWVAEHLPQVQEQFLQQVTVEQRAIHIPIQIKLRGKPIDDFSAHHLRSIFQSAHRAAVCFILMGEGGVGKTSLACQIAQWGMVVDKQQDQHLNQQPDSQSPASQPLSDRPMLPVLIEQELGDTPLLTAIRAQLPRTQEGSFIAAELLEALLKQRRVLVILDHVSEMSDKTYSQMQQALEKTAINALIITTRLPDKDLGRVPNTRLEPQKNEGGVRLSIFIQSYLEQRGKRDLFEDDADFHRTCTRLSTMMASTLQTATALLVKLYVEQVIDAGGLKTAQLPDNIPELMKGYLVWLNREEAIASSRRQDDITIRQAAKALAWECVKQTYVPASIADEAALKALVSLSPAPDAKPDAKPDGKADARACLDYLDKRLRLVQVTAGKVRIILDPVAEYLAALHLVDYCQQECQQEEAPERWQQFLQSVDAQPDRARMRGFLLAVRNCCDSVRRSLPAGVLEELNQRANLDPAALEQVRRRQRINKLIDDLDLYDNDRRYLGQAIQNLQEEGAYAARAIPDLVKLVRSPQPQPDLRVAALNALAVIQTDAAALEELSRALLADREDVSEVRVAAVAVLRQVSQNREGLIALLTHYLADEAEIGVVRVQAGEGLRHLGVLTDLLVVQVDQANLHTIQRVLPPPTRVLTLAAAADAAESEGTQAEETQLGDITLTLVHIPGGEFEMGSPEGEGFDKERPRHRVMVPEFWMGQTTVTQAQYEAVMQRTSSTFRGANRPVETVSWYEAVEFCQRLSARLGAEFRLPSEAEWEYACRAESAMIASAMPGTATPFHFGATLTTDLANYRGTDYEYGGRLISGSYGAGPKGVYREQTVEVGSFPPNALGLYDMHGNVWEWCLDHWHDSYEGAPTDGSAWITENDNANRLLRGGAWNIKPLNCRLAYRRNNSPGLRNYSFGFRIVLLAA